MVIQEILLRTDDIYKVLRRLVNLLTKEELMLKRKVEHKMLKRKVEHKLWGTLSLTLPL